VIAELSTALQFEQGLCVIADDEHASARRLAAWHRDGAAPADARAEADALAIALAMPSSRVTQRVHDGQQRFIVALRSDGKTLGALVLQGVAMAPLAEFEHVLVTIGEQLGQYIQRKQAERVLAHSEALSFAHRAVVRLVLGMRCLSSLRHSAAAACATSMPTTGAALSSTHRVGAVRPGARKRGLAAHRSQLMRRERFIDFQFAVRLPDGTLR
jgi:hypothetical protein